MRTVAYLANEFPSTVEWYVVDEIRELRRRGVRVIAGTGRRADPSRVAPELSALANEALCLWPPTVPVLLAAAWLALRKARIVLDVIRQIHAEGNQRWRGILRALAHTALGVCYAEKLRPLRVDHIHVHHGYYASWIAMVAARLLDVPFSLTLHGSDLLVHGSRLETKLKHCAFCITISEYNRRYILSHFPQVDAQKILLQRLGVEIPPVTVSAVPGGAYPLTVLSVGRLHAIKNHQFLVQACFFLKESGVPFQCWIIGEGPERVRLEFLIRELNLGDAVRLVGEVPHTEIGRYYELADLVVLTSHSEGVPLVLMEAMARARLVLAPGITGIPELVIDGQTGFLYQPGALEEFVWRVQQIACSLPALTSMRHAAQQQVRTHFEHDRNLAAFAEAFLERAGTGVVAGHADPVLQQI